MLLLEEKDDHSEERHLRLEVRDWGIGFDRDRVLDAGEHVGMQSMIERVQLMDGHFEVHGRPGEGAAVRATFPIPAEDKEGEAA